jgi:hypothetical protein
VGELTERRTSIFVVQELAGRVLEKKVLLGHSLCILDLRVFRVEFARGKLIASTSWKC